MVIYRHHPTHADSGVDCCFNIIILLYYVCVISVKKNLFDGNRQAPDGAGDGPPEREDIRLSMISEVSDGGYDRWVIPPPPPPEKNKNS